MANRSLVAETCIILASGLGCYGVVGVPLIHTVKHRSTTMVLRRGASVSELVMNMELSQRGLVLLRKENSGKFLTSSPGWGQSRRTVYESENRS